MCHYPINLNGTPLQQLTILDFEHCRFISDNSYSAWLPVAIATGLVILLSLSLIVKKRVGQTNDAYNREEVIGQICQTAHSEFPQLPSTIGKEQVTTTDITRSELPRTKTKKEDAQVEKELNIASLSMIGKKQEKLVTTTEKHTLPSDNRELVEVNHSLQKESTVTSFTIRNIFIELKLLASRWHEIGILLDMEPGKLNIIKADNPGDAVGCLRHMIEEWLNSINPRPTWEELVEAIKDINERKSEDIRLKYCTREPH